MQQPKCSHCGNARCKHGAPSVHVLDVAGWEIHKQQFVCEAIAQQLGILPQKQQLELSLPPDVLANLLGDLKPGTAAPATGDPTRPRPQETICTGCRLTLGAFKMRGRVGCPRCYETFRPQLVPLLERVHDATAHRGRFPGRPARIAPDPVDLTELRTRLQTAIAQERYEEAARLRDSLKKLSGGLEPDRDDGSGAS
ncbi:MAG: UvrB/UvrC motif-containing protein [Planctomycetes bacterium]|nr:UvrB/UvrC motif-containing protein [Planctomycetota bacterium]